MRKRFKTRKKSKLNPIKVIAVLLVIYVSFNVFYILIYNLYLKNLNNEQIITHIINNTKNHKSSNKIIEKFQNPTYILSNNFTIKNSPPTINVENTLKNDVEVYIYCTHETESYSAKYLEVYNIKPNVTMMSHILKDYLNDLGINVLVEEKSVTDVLKAHKWSYKYSYDASKEIAEDTIKNNSSLKLIIDLHRDSAALSKTKMTIDDTDYARVLFVIGAEHEKYEENLKVANKLNELINKEVPDISRGISQKSGAGVNGIYNQNLSPKSVLIELGGQYNEIEELNNTLKILAKVILEYIEGE